MNINTIHEEQLHLLFYKTKHQIGRLLQTRRDKAFALSAFTALLAKTVTVATLLLTVPMTFTYLGAERYGLWLTITSFSMLVSFADLGLGNGMLALIASRLGKDDNVGIQAIISNGYAALLLISASILTVFEIAKPLVRWTDLLAIRYSNSDIEATNAVEAFAVCFAIGIPVYAIQKIQSGLQLSYFGSLWQATGSVSMLAATAVGIYSNASLPLLLLLTLSAPLFVSFANTVHFFRGQGKQVLPTIRLLDFSEIGYITSTGMIYFFTQALVSMCFGFDSVIVSRQLGAAFVPQLAVPERLFGLIGMLTATIIAPLWPAYGEAVSRSDYNWTVSTFRRSIVFVIISVSLLGLALVFLGPYIIRIWVGDKVSATFWLLLGLAVWRFVDSIANVFTTLLNGLGAIRSQLAIYMGLGLVITPLKIYFVSRFGLAGLPWATSLAYAVVFGLPAVFVVRHSLRDLRRRAHETEKSLQSTQVQACIL